MKNKCTGKTAAPEITDHLSELLSGQILECMLVWLVLTKSAAMKTRLAIRKIYIINYLLFASHYPQFFMLEFLEATLTSSKAWVCIYEGSGYCGPDFKWRKTKFCTWFT